ncbi:Uncharacterised protein [Yersinia rohdei]|uniref:hypothetical protein n=1 Tax=Yersinia rohdei TaxID=29485 RepID=UPI0005E853A1|nr:hypothetical protein [Yersinia rohdei]CND92167.1 Uncharacterised protein [Yersinia rohdei]CQJ56503.1 Uncharacterised protein [Yersinia rohdei]
MHKLQVSITPPTEKQINEVTDSLLRKYATVKATPKNLSAISREATRRIRKLTITSVDIVRAE